MKEYNPSGRLQTEEGAKVIDVELKKLLEKHHIAYADRVANRDAPRIVCKDVLMILGKVQPPPVIYFGVEKL